VQQYASEISHAISSEGVPTAMAQFDGNPHGIQLRVHSATDIRIPSILRAAQIMKGAGLDVSVAYADHTVKDGDLFIVVGVPNLGN